MHSSPSSLQSGQEVDVPNFKYQRLRDQDEPEMETNLPKRDDCLTQGKADHNSPEHREEYQSDQDYHCQTPPQDLAILSGNQDRSKEFTEVTQTAFEGIPQRDDYLTQGEADNSGLNTPEHQEEYQIQDTDQDHHCQTPPQEHVIHENLSLTTAPIPGLSVDQERPEWFTEMCKMTDTDMEDALQREDSLTYSHETQILLPPSGPPIDPYNTREYIPTCFTPVATLSQCTHGGRQYNDEHNDFGLEIPAGGIPEGESITIDIGVALYGPFQYPEGPRPVSPVFWICVRDWKDFQFLKPVKVTIPHCLNLESHDDIESLGLTFLKGNHEMNPQQMYQLQHAGDELIEPLKKYGVVQTTHFCSLCISCKDTMKLIEKAHFCLYSVIPRVISSDKPSFAYFFITFLLKTCLKTVKSQTEDLNLQNYEQKPEEFQFKLKRGKFQLSHVKELEIVLPKSDSLPAGWMVGMQGKKKVI